MRRWIGVALAAAVVGGIVGTSVAQRAPDPNLSTAGRIELVKTIFAENLVGTDDTTWTTVNSVIVNLPVKSLVVARFAAEHQTLARISHEPRRDLPAADQGARA